MTILRQLLVKIRSWYYSDERRKVIQKLIAVLAIATIAGFALDLFTPFSGLWTVGRSLILIPIATTAFMLGYMLTLGMNDRQKEKDPRWLPMRQRYSPRRRVQIAIVGGAVLLVMVYALAPIPGYTLIASLIVSVGIALISFTRRTLKETRQADLGLPDSRDADYNRVVDQAKARREAKMNEKSTSKKVRRERILRGRKAAESLERELEGD